MRLSALWSVAFSAVLSAPLVALAGQAGLGCPSAEACLSSSLERNWTQYQSEIEQGWADKVKVAALIERARALGRQDVVDRLREEKERIDSNWAYMEQVARTLTSERFETHLRRQHQKAADATLYLKTKLERETELYRRLKNSTIGPERDGVIQDILTYGKEQKDLLAELLDDSIGLALSSMSRTMEAYHEMKAMTKTAEKAQGGKMTPVAAAKAAAIAVSIDAFLESGKIAHRGVGAAAGIQASRQETGKVGSRKELIELYKFTAASAASTAELIASLAKEDAKQLIRFTPRFKTTIKAISKGAIWFDFGILAMDSVRLGLLFYRFNVASARQGALEAIDAYWRDRVEGAGAMVAHAKARQARAERNIEHQRRIKSVFEEIKRQARP